MAASSSPGDPPRPACRPERRRARVRAPSGLFATRDVADLVASTEEEGGRLEKSIGPVALTALGVGAIIGTGFFVVIGEGAAAGATALVLSIVAAPLACLFSALSYAELASSVIAPGSAYTYSYATM